MPKKLIFIRIEYFHNSDGIVSNQFYLICVSMNQIGKQADLQRLTFFIYDFGSQEILYWYSVDDSHIVFTFLPRPHESQDDFGIFL